MARARDGEYEDVAAVVDAVAAAFGRPVDVYGHSHGAIVAFGAATLTPNLGNLLLYEGWPVPDRSAYLLPPAVSTLPRMTSVRSLRRCPTVGGWWWQGSSTSPASSTSTRLRRTC